MKKLAALLLLVCSLCNAQPSTGVTYDATANLLQNRACGSWTNTICPAANGGTSGGYLPGYNNSTDTIIFGYTYQTVAQTIAINKALSGSGIQIGGYDYSWKIHNNDSNIGTIVGNVTLKGVQGNVVQSYIYDYSNIRTTGLSENFQQFNGTEWFPENYPVESLSNITLSWYGKDNKYWAGYWGPRVREASLSLRYIADICSSNPLSSPNCSGYQQAYHDQQCLANPLYASDCMGYQQAYMTMQCSSNPLYNSACPGYFEAYKSYQCSINALYDTTCPGYEMAYFKEQCIRNSLYDKKCEGYSTAYAIKYLVKMPSEVSGAVNQQLTTIVEVQRADPANITVVNSTVDSVISTPSTTSVTSATSVTSVIAPKEPSVSNTNMNNQTEMKSSPPAQSAERQDQKKTDGAVASVERKTGGNKADAKKEAANKAKELANEVGKAATMEQQQAAQGMLVGLMGYVPGFSAYNITIKDVNEAELTKRYGKPVIDNRGAQRRLSGANETKWKEMVDSQYRN